MEDQGGRELTIECLHCTRPGLEADHGFVLLQLSAGE